MKGLHINWTAPFFARRSGEYFVEDFEILTTILSAASWKAKNGEIKLCADKQAIEFYKEAGLLNLYDEIEELKVDKDINPEMFWAAGKLFALRNQKAPVAVIDTDFIVWDEILFDKLGECTVIHFEDLYADVYPGREFFEMKEDYEWPQLDWSLKACNTAFMVIKSDLLIQEYTQMAVNFMKNAKNTGDPLKYIVFAEQRLINMCAKRLGIATESFSDLKKLFANGDGCFTHTWGMKQQMRDMPWLRHDFCMRCLSRIRRDFPEYIQAAERAVRKKQL